LEFLDEFFACVEAITQPAAGAPLGETCRYIEQTTSCYPKCLCDDAEFAKEFESMAELTSGVCGSVTCGPKAPKKPVADAASGLRATALSTTLLAVLVAVVAACPRR
jgi:hypothetical protein